MERIAIPLSLYVALVVTNALLAIFSLIANSLMRKFYKSLSPHPSYMYLEQASTILFIIFVVSAGLSIGLIIEYVKS